MKERIKGAFTKRKILHFLKMALFVVALSLILLSLLGTVAHATGLVEDTINAENLYSKYPLSNYQLDFYVDNSWSWLPWNWLAGCCCDPGGVSAGAAACAGIYGSQPADERLFFSDG